jgi:hypothetical protein
MLTIKISLLKSLMLALLGSSLLLTGAARAHEGHEHAPAASASAKAKAQPAKRAELGSSAALDATGKLWVASKESSVDGDFVVVRGSSDDGKTWSAPRRVNRLPEAIAAQGEDGPKLSFGPKGQMYVSWTRPTGKNYSGDIRFSASTDGGAVWSAAVNVHRDEQVITHRFGSMIVDRSGRIFIIWIDKRDAVAATAANGAKYEGGALYYAVSDDGGAHWRGDFKIADHSCECCRIALTQDAEGAPLAFWRHVYPSGERDHALVKLTADGKVGPIQRATFDGWKIEACPHQGPALAVADQTTHAVWFDVVGNEGKVFYGRLQADKVDGQRALPDPRAENATISAIGQRVWVVWKSFDGKKNNIGSMSSSDGGKTWTEKVVASATGNVDQPHLMLQGNAALLVWNTDEQGVQVRRLP